jgi:acyl carrier protein
VDIQQFIGFVEEALSISPGTIQESDHLEGLDGWDSIGVISVMAVIEDRYGVALDPVKLLNCQTVGDLNRFTQESMASG